MRKRVLSNKLKTSNGVKVLLCEDVKKLGWFGDIVEVNEGYARNFLLPRGLARIATADNIKALAKEKTARAEQRVKEHSRLTEVAKNVEGAEAVLAAKANEQGILFGSITAKQIAANLRAQGFEVADDVVELPHHIKQIGTHSVTLRFAEDLTTTVTVTIVSEGAAITAEQKEGQREKGKGESSEGA
jgi:large subunit ribosomal protein L9